MGTLKEHVPKAASKQPNIAAGGVNPGKFLFP